MASPADIASVVVENGKPVLLVDACSVLDILRDVYRRDATTVVHAHRIDTSREMQPMECNVVMSSIVSGEIRDYRESILQDLTTSVKSHEKMRREFELALRTLSPGAVPSQDLDRKTLIAELDGLVGRLAANAHILDEGDAVKLRGTARALAGTPPAKKGQHKDCIITEGYLELGRELKKADHGGAVVFLTSNVKDFCENRVLHPDLKDEFNSAGLLFAHSWEHAAFLLGLQPEDA